jgi:hypothetical protein
MAVTPPVVTNKPVRPNRQSASQPNGYKQRLAGSDVFPGSTETGRSTAPSTFTKASPRKMLVMNTEIAGTARGFVEKLHTSESVQMQQEVEQTNMLPQPAYDLNSLRQRVLRSINKLNKVDAKNDYVILTYLIWQKQLSAIKIRFAA